MGNTRHDPSFVQVCTKPAVLVIPAVILRYILTYIYYYMKPSRQGLGFVSGSHCTPPWGLISSLALPCNLAKAMRTSIDVRRAFFEVMGWRGAVLAYPSSAPAPPPPRPAEPLTVFYPRGCCKPAIWLVLWLCEAV